MRRLSWFLIIEWILFSLSTLPGLAQLKDPHEGKLGDACGDCHTLDGWKPSTYTVDRHQSSAYPLKGKHQQVECSKCHLDKLFKGASTDCYSCHETTDQEKGHRNQLGKDCANCHQEEDWAKYRFDLERHQETEYPLQGKHQQVECAKCHVDRNYRIEDVTCMGCHVADEERVHRGELGNECKDCHTLDGWKPSTYDHAERTIQKIERSRIRHWMAWALPEFLTPKDKVTTYRYLLVNQHAEAKCGDCHVENRYRNTPDDCVACHQKNDTHAGRLGQDCSRCHSPRGWEYLHFDHSQVGFALVGQHARVPCENCHTEEQYHELTTHCQQCHLDNIPHAQDTASECEFCHTPWNWKILSFEHDALRLPLEGKHAQVDCYDCHTRDSFRGLNDACIQCHEDPHEGDFGVQCDVCHTPISWETSAFNHDATGFSLTGKHRGLDCGGCHQLPGYKGLNPACNACHTQDSPPDHFGPTCEDCHSTAAWQPANFQHLAFPIDSGKHKLSCNRCHIVPGDYRTFSCISGGCHPQSKIDSEHKGEVSGYVYESSACYRCHPQGKEDD